MRQYVAFFKCYYVSFGAGFFFPLFLKYEGTSLLGRYVVLTDKWLSSSRRVVISPWS